VETFKLTVDDMADENKTFEVPYGANILEFIAGKVETGNVAVNTELHKGYLVWTGYWEVVDSEAEEVTKDDVMSGNLEICAPMISTGWERSEADDPWSYFDENGGALLGWNQIDGAWYYFIEDEVDGWHYRAEGLTRVPYPSVEINGVKYAPNQEDIDYFAAKGKEFMDATEAWFIFDENGKFQSDVNGKYEGPKATCYAVNGMIPWHYGLAKITNKYYYFVGDAVNGGNKVADGPVWVTRTNGVEGLEAGACYYFLGGVMANNLTDIVDGKYFENGKYMIGAGLVKVGEDYYYVRSSGKFATGKYYITKTNGIEGFETGMKLYFDEDGKMLPIKNGAVEEGGELYFYQNNHMMCGAGLIEYKGAIYYVRSSGKVATGTYYITNTNGMEGFEENDKLLFGEDGKLIVTEKKEGIVEEGGALYYYQNGRIAYAAGLLEIDTGVYIYVRSNGQLAVGEYYITNTNGMKGFESGEAVFFGDDGKLTAN
jgi:glucan-binding YG repeat protein